MIFTKQGEFIKKPLDFPDIPSKTTTPAEMKATFEGPSDELKTTVNNIVDGLNSEKWVNETRIGDDSVSRRTIQAGAIGFNEIDPTILAEPTTEIGQQAKFAEIDSQLADISKVQFHFLPIIPVATVSVAAGDCSLIISEKGKTILIDTGNTDSYTLIKDYLDNIGVNKIDYFIVSHYHPDHVDNIQSLYADFDFSKTIAYIQKDSNYIGSDGWKSHDEYEKAITTLSGNTIIYPDNGDTLVVDDLTFKFFNCSQSDIDYYNGGATTNYNDHSMCTTVYHKNVKALFTGDIWTISQGRIYGEGYFEKVDILKVQHHGYDTDVNSDYIQTVQPKYGVISNAINTFNTTGIPGEISSDTHNSGLKNATLSYLTAIGCKNYVLGYEGGMAFTSNGYIVQPNQRYQNKYFGGWHSDFPIYIYVDGTVTQSNNDGTYNKPFKKVQEALAFASGLVGQRVLIKVSDGDYPEDIQISSSQAKIKIQGNTSDNTKVKIKSFISYDANVVLDSVNIYGTNSIVVAFNDSHAEMDNCLADGEVTDWSSYASGRGICAYNSHVYINGGKVANKTTAVSAYNASTVTILNMDNANCDYVVSPNSGNIITSGVGNYANKAFMAQFSGKYSGSREKGTTTERQKFVDATSTGIVVFYDTTLNKPTWWNGTAWKDATGTTV